MTAPVVLASGSEIRHQLLSGAALCHSVENARIDEGAIIGALQAEDVEPRDIADSLAEGKAKKISHRHPGSLVIGCDQVLEFRDKLLQKPGSQQQAIGQLQMLEGQTHRLFSAVVVYKNEMPQWRFVGTVKITMRTISNEYLVEYVDRNWASIQNSVGCYKLEEEGSRLISNIEGDYFSVLGLPLIELLTYLTQTGELPA